MAAESGSGGYCAITLPARNRRQRRCALAAKPGTLGVHCLALRTGDAAVRWRRRRAASPALVILTRVPVAVIVSVSMAPTMGISMPATMTTPTTVMAAKHLFPESHFHLLPVRGLAGELAFTYAADADRFRRRADSRQRQQIPPSTSSRIRPASGPEKQP